MPLRAITRHGSMFFYHFRFEADSMSMQDNAPLTDSYCTSDQQLIAYKAHTGAAEVAIMLSGFVPHRAHGGYCSETSSHGCV